MPTNGQAPVDEWTAPTPVTLDEAYQETIPGKALPVYPAGPVQTQALPSKVGSTETFQVAVGATTGGNGLQILPRDLKRRRALIVADQDIAVARTQSDKVGAYWPAKVALVLEHADAVYVIVSGNSTANVGVIAEVWAE